MWVGVGQYMVKKVAIISSNESFLGPILQELKKRDTIVEKLLFHGDTWEDGARFQDLMDWADCVFFDFIHRPLPAATSWKTYPCRITARLHGLEVYDRVMRDVNWPKVNLICSTPQKMRFDMLKLPEQPASITTLNLGVDVKPTSKPKEVFGYNIGINAISPLPRKGIYPTIETFCELLQVTKNRGDMDGVHWYLHVRGMQPSSWRQAESVEYLNFINELRITAQSEGIELDKHLVIHDWMERERFEAWLAGMDIMLSNSMQEGYHKVIFEAMAYGAFPLVHRWMGASTLFPPESLFLTQSELVHKILDWYETEEKDKRAMSRKVQSYVRLHHNEVNCAKQAVDVILGEI
jgi:hypothetical protein